VDGVVPDQDGDIGIQIAPATLRFASTRAGIMGRYDNPEVKARLDRLI